MAPLPAIVHLLGVECRAHVVLYLSSVVLMNGVAWESIVSRRDRERWSVQHFNNIAEIAKQKRCTKSGIEAASWSLNPNFEHKCYRSHDPGYPNVLGWMRWPMLTVLALKLIGFVCEFLVNVGILSSWQNPLYLQWTWKVEGKTWYKVLSHALWITLVINLIAGLVVLYQVHGWLAFKIMLIDNFTTLLAQALAATAIANTNRPAWQWNDETFQKCEIVRPWQNLMTSNDSWASSCGDALLQSKKGQPEALKGIITNIDAIGGADVLISKAEGLLGFPGENDECGEPAAAAKPCCLL